MRHLDNAMCCFGTDANDHEKVKKWVYCHTFSPETAPFASGCNVSRHLCLRRLLHGKAWSEVEVLGLLEVGGLEDGVSYQVAVPLIAHTRVLDTVGESSVHQVVLKDETAGIIQVWSLVSFFTNRSPPNYRRHQPCITRLVIHQRWRYPVSLLLWQVVGPFLDWNKSYRKGIALVVTPGANGTDGDVVIDVEWTLPDVRFCFLLSDVTNV